MSIDKWMDKVVVHTNTGILLSHKKEQNWVICSDVDEPGACHTEWIESEERNIIYYCTYMEPTKMVQFSPVIQLCPTLCYPIACSTPGFPVHHQLPEPTWTHVHWISEAIQPSHPLSSPSPLAFKLSQHLGLFKWVSSSHQVVKVLEFQLQLQSFQWIFRTDFL